MTHAQKLKRIHELIESPDVIELWKLSAEVAAYEKKTYQIPLPTIAEAMRFRREQMGETRVEIAERAGLDVAEWIYFEDEDGDHMTMDEACKLFAIGIPAEVLFSQDNQTKP